MIKKALKNGSDSALKSAMDDFKKIRRNIKTRIGVQVRDGLGNFRAELKRKRRGLKDKIKKSRFCKKYFKKIAEKNLRKQQKEINRMIADQSRINYYRWEHSCFPAKATEKRFIWFVPDWENVWGGGHYTLFRFANHFANRDGIKNIIFIYNDSKRRDVATIEAELKGAIKNCKLEVILNPELLPSCEAAFATTWQSAYDVKAFPYAKTKFYFMQDYESQFYAFGTQSMQANNSYKLGFYGITGGTWLRQNFENYGGTAQNYIFSTDKNIFYPSGKGEVREKVSRIFFYGRPSTERRCFELGIAALNEISKLYPDVEIVIAGLKLEADLLPFKATLLGNLSLKQTGDLYRTCDIGIAFSGTNLSYLPVELMASGCPVLTNNGPQTEWYCNDENSMLVDPIVASVIEGFEKLYNSKSLRQSLVNNGLEKSKSTSWEKEMDKIYDYILSKLS